MKILFVGVFDKDKKSTNTSQILSFKRLGHEVTGYNYRTRARIIGNKQRDEELIKLVKEREFDLIVYSKCNVVSKHVFADNRKHSKTCLWFMDPLVSYTQEMMQKTSLVDYFCCDKLNVLELALKENKNSFHICEGYDSDLELPKDCEKKYDVSFIGNMYGGRREKISQINHPVKIISNAHGRQHSVEVSKSNININFCTSQGASDRVYKILAAGGFLLTDDWLGRRDMFVDKEDLVIFKNIKDLNEKIDFYMKNPKDRKKIAASGLQKVQKYTRLNWAKRIVEIYEQL